MEAPGDDGEQTGGPEEDAAAGKQTGGGDKRAGAHENQKGQDDPYTLTSTERDILRDLNFEDIMKDFSTQKTKRKHF